MNEEVSVAWETVAMPITFKLDVYRFAVERLLSNLGQLPGAFCVRVPDPPYAMGHASWQSIKRHTVALHECGRYRLAVPERGRTNFLLPSSPKIIEITEDVDIYIVPWGGSAHSAYLKLGVEQDALIEERWPFADLRQNTRRRFGIQSCTRHIGLALHGDGTIHDITVGINGSSLPICRIVKEGTGVFVLPDMAATAVSLEVE